MAVFGGGDTESLIPFSTFCDTCVCFLFGERATSVIGLLLFLVSVLLVLTPREVFSAW